MVIRTHQIVVRKSFDTNNGVSIKKGAILECRVRTYQDQSGSEVSDIHMLRVFNDGIVDNSFVVPDTVFNLNAGCFRFLDTADRID